MTPKKVLDGLHIVFVELPKFKAKNLTEKKMQVLWLRFLTEIDENTKKVDKALLDDPHVSEALEIVEESAYSDAERYEYERFWDYASREATKEADMKTAVAQRDAAVARADAEKARADAATETLRQTVFNLKAMGLSIEQIVAATGLTAAEINAL